MCTGSEVPPEGKKGKTSCVQGPGGQQTAGHQVSGDRGSQPSQSTPPWRGQDDPPNSTDITGTKAKCLRGRKTAQPLSCVAPSKLLNPLRAQDPHL